MNLYTFPQSANESNGYSIVVKSDFEKLNFNSKQNKVIWYSSHSVNDCLDDNDLIINRPSGLSMKRFYNVLSFKPSTELLPSDLSEVKDDTFDSIFCGDTIMYRALRKTFPETKIVVRFHNCFYRIRERIKMLNLSMDAKFKHLLMACYQLELEIFSDENVEPIFLCKEDQQFYESITGRNDSSLWNVEVRDSIRKEKEIKSYSNIKYLVYFGGIDTHKKKSVDFFVQFVYPKIKTIFPEIEFHLYGTGSEIYQSKNNKIFGHGRYHGDDFPHSKDGLYLNPDITGGGVKIKIKSYIENNLRFVSTPFGYEGYSMKYIDNKSTWILPIKEWAEGIINIIKENK